MITNRHISLEKSSLLRTDAINSIKYTLLLNYRLPKITDIDNPIPAVMQCCNQCCKELFQNNSSTEQENNKICFNFFGTPYALPRKIELLKKEPNLSLLDEFPPNKEYYPEIDKTGFLSMILDHCILSCYHAILTELMHEKTVTSYEITNNIKSNGIYSLYKKNQLDFESDCILKKIRKSSFVTVQSSSRASDFTRLTKTHLKLFPNMQSLFVAPSSNSNASNAYQYFLQFSSIFSYLCNIDARCWKFFSSSITDHNKDSTFDSFKNLSQALLPKFDKKGSSVFEYIFPKPFSNPVDAVYHYYLIERIFNYNLFYSLLHNIHRVETKTNYKLCQNYILNILYSCKKLPNSFSRQYFLQYAFDQLIFEPMSYLDFWNSHRFDMSTSPLEAPLDSEKKKYFQFPRWLDQFSLFCNYMAEYAIPIYEWCFTNMIMDTMEQIIPDTPNSTQGKKLHRKRLVKAMEYLANYINEHWKQILSPIDFPAYQDAVDIITPYKKDNINFNFSAELLQTLFTNFFSLYDEIDLNLSPLNPSFFLSKRNNRGCSNKTVIHNFYLNLLYPN